MLCEEGAQNNTPSIFFIGYIGFGGRGVRRRKNPPPMSHFSLLTGHSPIPTVHPDDVKAVWELMHSVPVNKSGGGVGISISLVAETCRPGADVPAVFARTTLIEGLLQLGSLKAWVAGSQLSDSVFWSAATFPLPQGLSKFEEAVFLARLKDHEQ